MTDFEMNLGVLLIVLPLSPAARKLQLDCTQPAAAIHGDILRAGLTCRVVKHSAPPC